MATEMVHVTQAKNVKSEEEEPKETALWDSEHVAFLPSKNVERLQIKIAPFQCFILFPSTFYQTDHPVG